MRQQPSSYLQLEMWKPSSCASHCYLCLLLPLLSLQDWQNPDLEQSWAFPGHCIFLSEYSTCTYFRGINLLPDITGISYTFDCLILTRKAQVPCTVSSILTFQLKTSVYLAQEHPTPPPQNADDTSPASSLPTTRQSYKISFFMGPWVPSGS